MDVKIFTLIIEHDYLDDKQFNLALEAMIKAGFKNGLHKMEIGPYPRVSPSLIVEKSNG